MSRLCPKCQTDLFEVQSQGSTLHFCSHCRGVWFNDNELLYHLRARTGDAEIVWTESTLRATHLNCPNCGSALKETPFNICSEAGCISGSFLLVDFCAQCNGIWLDEGEMQKAEDLAKRLPKASEKFSEVFEKVEAQYPHNSNKIKVPFAAMPFAAFIAVFGILLIYSNLALRSDEKNSTDSISLKTCRTCSGSGRQKSVCAVCRGLGKVSSLNSRSAPCPYCGGSGRSQANPGRCYKCNGSGWISNGNESCTSCGGSGRIADSAKRTCPSCSGTGHVTVQEVCSICGGSGKSVINPGMGCPGCNGSGYSPVRKTCAQCSAGIIEARYEKMCPVCRGLGKAETGKRPCGDCMGTGTLDASLSGGACVQCSGSGTMLVSGSNAVICLICNGTGIEKETACAACDGKGEVRGS